MKKLILLVICLGILGSVAFAGEQQNKGSQNREMDIMPQQELSKDTDTEKNKWSFILENELGSYAYDNTSVSFLEDKKGKKDSNIVKADIKTIVVNKELLKRIDGKYANQLKNGDTTDYCVMHMIFNRAEETYKVTSLQVFSMKRKTLEDKVVNNGFSPIPKKSFVKATLKVLNQYIEVNIGDMLFTKRYLVI